MSASDSRVALQKPARRLRRRGALLVASVVVALYATEVLSTILERSRPDRGALLRRHGVTYDARTSAAVVRDAQRRGEDVMPHVTAVHALARRGPSDGLALPLGGISRQRVAFSNEAGPWMFVTTDEHGFHNDSGGWQSQPQVMLVGDSLGEGFVVRRADNIAGRLIHRGWRVLNVALAGFGPLLELAVLREYVKPKRPAIVFWLYFEGNDLRDLRYERRSELLLRYVRDPGFSQGLLRRQHEIDRIHRRIVVPPLLDPSARQQKSSQLERILRFASLRSRIQRLRRPAPAPSGLPLLERVLARARGEVREWGGQLVFVYLCEHGRYVPGSVDGKRSRNEVLELVHRLGLPLVDGDRVFRDHGDPLSLFPYRERGHYAVSGYEVIAAALDVQARRLLRRK